MEVAQAPPASCRVWGTTRTAQQLHSMVAAANLGGEGMTLNGEAYRDRAVTAFQPVSDMLDVGRCEPLKAVVHGVLLVTVGVCAAYNAAAWLKRRQRHLAINAVI